MSASRRPVPALNDVAHRSSHDQLNDELFAKLSTAGGAGERALITDQLLRANLGLADSLANRYAHAGAERDDLVQVARTALLLAIRRYQIGQGRSFAAFASPTITGELKRYFRDHGWVIRPPRPIQELRSRVRVERAELEQVLGRAARAAEIAEALAVEPGRVSEAVLADSSYRPRSIEAALDDSGDYTLGDGLADPSDPYGRVVDRLALRRVLADLSGRDRAILLWRFEEGCSQTEIGRRLGISQMQVSRLIRRILTEARLALEDEQLAG